MKFKRILKPWFYVAALVGSQLFILVPAVFLSRYFPDFIYWTASPFGTFSITVAGGGAAFLVVLLATCPQSTADFLRIFELNSIAKNISYSGIIAGFILGVTGVLIVQRGLVGFAEESPLTRPFIHQPGLKKHFFTILLIIGPLFEEIIMRGFLYRAFRKNYGISVSILIIIAVATLTHCNVMMTSIVIFLVLVILQIILCLLLEKTQNLWNPIICHVAYNSAVTVGWLIGVSHRGAS